MKKEELLERSETFLRGFFEKGLPVEDLLAGADPVDFSWIGPGEKEFFDNRDALLAWYRRAAVQKARKTGPVIALEMQCAFPRRRRRGSHRPLLGVRRTEPSRIPGHPHLHEKTGPPPPCPRAPLRPVGQGRGKRRLPLHPGAHQLRIPQSRRRSRPPCRRAEIHRPPAAPPRLPPSGIHLQRDRRTHEYQPAHRALLRE